MLELASLGSKVLQIRAVEFAGKYKVPLRVVSTFVDGPGTLITLEDSKMMEDPLVSGIAFNRDAAQLTVAGVPDRPGIARSEEHTSELQSLMRITYAVFCLKKKT